ncbi:ComEC/Rec2 family competence protein [Virgibacillus necropolis]|uniref:Competence protein n=1 Tax=Virgibacillus necropolis TaxID=163877 RepID=A0A221MGV6_9BACI|nr:ComEC/Rec2 family competence protein [Virgibacillus necropolis]ASN06886.1 competence protein [Virgibacillus necropolis]
MKKFKWYLVVLLMFIHVIQPGDAIHAEQQSNMEVHFIDVGQGDSILLETPENKTILIDGGTPESGDDIVEYLKKQQVTKIDLLIVTHPDIDHIGGLTKVMKSTKVKKVLDSGKLYTTKTYRKYISEIAKQNIPVEIAEKNQLIKLDPSIKIKVLNTYEPFRSNNESSIALKVTYKKMDFLFMGDIKKEQEKELIQTEDLQAEILKVAHHGSKTSTSIGFLEEVRPEVAILTYSKKNDYGHPVGRVIQNLYQVNAFIFSTAVFGNISITTNGTEYYIWTEKGPKNGIGNAAS